MDEKEGIKMEFDTLKKSHKKEIIVGVVAIILITIVLLVRNSFAKYQTTKNIKIAEGTINYTIPDFKVMAMYKNDGNGDTPIDTMPESGYKINTEKSYCTTDNVNKVYNKVFTNEDGKHVITGLSKDSKCYIYFDKQITKKVDTSIGIIEVNLDTPDFNKTSCTSGCEEATIGIYESKDDDGTTYYWRGDTENNYVKFAGYYWRIIRINGDGTIRLIYQGTSETSTGTNAQIGRSEFNSSYDDNKYVGFKYTDNDVHGTGTESTILGTLNTWYETNLDKTGIKDKIDANAGFCNDRDPYTDEAGTTSGGGTGTATTYYGAYIRLFSNRSTNATPTFKCKNSSDLFTKSGAIKKDGTANGNRALNNPIGLITADEVVYAGGYHGNNTSYYLYTGQVYWTLSPYIMDGYGDANVFVVDSHGYLYGWDVCLGNGVRPVINLKADTKFTYKSETTKGTASDPYVVDASN